MPHAAAPTLARKRSRVWRLSRKPSPGEPIMSSAGTLQSLNSNSPIGCGAIISVRSATLKPGIRADTTKAEISARTGTRDDGRAEISAFVVSARMPGFRVADRTEMIAPHPIGELEFKDCKAPTEDMIGSPGYGLRLSLQTLDLFGAAGRAAACAPARRALDQRLPAAN